MARRANGLKEEWRIRSSINLLSGSPTQNMRVILGVLLTVQPVMH
jgi:hypothetical protein